MTPTEALAAALHRIHPGPRPWPGGLTDDEMADHVLAALDGWTLVPTAAPAKGLREAARAVVEAEASQDPLSSTLGDRLWQAITDLRAVLEADHD